MRNVATTAALVAALAGQSIAFQWPTEAIYNKWHETKLEKWLKDHNIPYPAASDRKALYDTVQQHWNKITPPYDQWSEKQLRDWLVESGSDAADLAASKKDDLVNLVTSTYEDSSDSIANWVLDSWTDSQLKAFLDYHKIPNPTPRNRDSVLQLARNAYSDMASIGPSAYDTLFAQWTDSDIKAWCDARGIPVPQGSKKESMLAAMRRNTKSFLDQAKAKVESLYTGAGDAMFDSWSESQLKEMFDENGIPVPQGTKINELRALARKNYKNLKNSASEYYAEGASSVSSAASSVGSGASIKVNEAAASAQKSAESAASSLSKKAATATGAAKKSAESAASVACKSAESLAAQAKKSLDSAASEASKTAASAGKQAKKSIDSATDEAAKSAKSAGKVAKDTAASAYDQAAKSAKSAGNEAQKTAAAYAADGKKSAESIYTEGSKTAGSAYAEAKKSASSLASQASQYAVGSDNFIYQAWSDSRLKSFLDARGITVPQNGKKDELIALVRSNSHKARLSAEDFEGWSSAQLNKFAKDAKIKLSNAAQTSREELVKQTSQGYTELQKKGDSAYTTAQQAYEAVKGYAYDTWSDSDLKSYLDSYGVSVPQSTTKDQLIAMARKNGHYFSHGQTGPIGGSGFVQMAYDGIDYLKNFILKAGGAGYERASDAAADAKEKVKAEL